MHVGHFISVAALAAVTVGGSDASIASAPVTMAWSTVGNAGNAADTTVQSDGTSGYGSVGYEYRIGTYEVTNAQYAAFLNAAAASDPNNLYSTFMGSEPRGGITRSGMPGSYTYSVRPNMGNKPVTFVSWYDAARMSNWMTNGQPSGGGGTESGVYTFTGETSISGITRDLSNPSQVFIPTEDEWYKAAYHHPAAQGGDADSYWQYATKSNSVPTGAGATSTGDASTPGPFAVNYASTSVWNGVDNVITVGSAASITFYGAFEMNGNVWEWNEALIGAERGYRGGGFGNLEPILRSSFRNTSDPTVGINTFGLRLASPAIPCVGDTNGDGVVNFADLNAVLSDFNQTGPDLPGDVNNDCVVNFQDLNLVVSSFSTTCQ